MDVRAAYKKDSNHDNAKVQDVSRIFPATLYSLSRSDFETLMLNCHQAVYQEEGCADGTDHVGPDAGGIHQSHAQRQAVLEKRTECRLEKDLEMPLHRQFANYQKIILLAMLSAIKETQSTFRATVHR